jgi:anti-sigma B factor antagonist
MSSPLTITQRTTGDVLVFVLSGHLVAPDGVRVFRDSITTAVAHGARACLLDLGDVSYVDSAGVGALVAAYRHVTSRGGHLKLLHPSLCARRVLGITHLTGVFDVFDKEDEAVHNMSSAQTVAHPHGSVT